MIRDAVYTLLQANANVTGLVDTRCVPGTLPQNLDHPCITYLMTGPRPETMTGTESLTAGSLRAICWSTTYNQARTLADYVLGALEGERGLHNSTKVYGIAQMDADDDQDPPIEGTDRGLFHVDVDFRVLYEET